MSTLGKPESISVATSDFFQDVLSAAGKLLARASLWQHFTRISCSIGALVMLLRQESLWIHFGLGPTAKRRSGGAMGVPMGGCTIGVPGF